MVDQVLLANLTASFRRPVLTMEALTIITDSTEDEILNAIEEGLLSFAFDLRSRRARRRRCIRVYGGTATSFDQVFAACFPGKGETIDSARIARRLVCSSQHVLNLVSEGLIRRQPGRLGPKESPRVYRASVAEFLEERRVR